MKKFSVIHMHGPSTTKWDEVAVAVFAMEAVKDRGTNGLSIPQILVSAMTTNDN